MNQEYRAIPYVFCCHRDGAASGGCYGPWPRALCLVGIVYYVGQNLAVWDILAIMRSKPSPLRASSLVLGLAG